MEPLFALLTDQQVHIYRLVLDASDIPYKISRQPSGWVIEIPQSQRSAAIDAVRLYLDENAEPLPRKRQSLFGGTRTFSAGYVVVALVALNGALQPGFERNVFIETYGADARAILDGQLYRCVTALLFHANWAHLLANAAGLLIFGTAVAASAGWGVGWLLIVLSGAGGNLLTALWYRESHLSIGSSTAVFAAVGLCAAFSILLHLRQKEGIRRAWLPIAAGVALLGFMGASPNSDLMAHLFGFCCGLAGGLFFAWRFPHRLPWQVQLPALLVLVLVVGASWIAGYRG